MTEHGIITIVGFVCVTIFLCAGLYFYYKLKMNGKE